MDKNLAIDDLKFFADQIWGFKEIYNKWLVELVKIRNESKNFDSTELDYFQHFIKPYSHKIDGIEIIDVNESNYSLKPSFESNYKFSGGSNYDYFIKGLKTNNNERLQLKLYLDTNQQRPYKDSKKIRELEKQIPKDYQLYNSIFKILGKRYNTKYEDLLTSGIYALVLQNLEIQERDYFDKLGEDFTQAIRFRKTIKFLKDKYERLIKPFEQQILELDKIKDEYIKNYSKNLNPWTVTFQWWDLESMQTAFPHNTKNGIKKVKVLSQDLYPNLIIFRKNKWKDIFLQLFIYAYQAKLLYKYTISELQNEFLKYFNISENNKGYYLTTLGKVFDNYLFPYEINHFNRYIRKIYKLTKKDTGDYFDVYDENSNNVKNIKSKYYTLLDAARLVGVQKKAVYTWIRRGKLTPKKLNEISDIDDFTTKGKWVFDDFTIKELKILAEKQNSRIDWDNYEIETHVDNYLKIHPNIKRQSAQRTIKRLINSKNSKKLKKIINYTTED